VPNAEDANYHMDNPDYVVIGARADLLPGAIAALMVGAVAVFTSPFWFIGGPLGVVAAVGVLAWRNGAGRSVLSGKPRLRLAGLPR
jgi:hypothetical protein